MARLCCQKPYHPAGRRLWLLVLAGALIHWHCGQPGTEEARVQLRRRIFKVGDWVKNESAKAVDVVTTVVDSTAGALRGIGDATAVSLGATCRLTGGLVRGLGHTVDLLGEAVVIDQGPIAAPSRVLAGVYRLVGATITGAGNATIYLGGAVEGIAAQASRVLEDTVRLAGEPTRTLGSALRGGSSQPRGGQRPRATHRRRGARRTPSRRSQQKVRRREALAERVAERGLEAAFGTPTERMVSLAPPLVLALLAAWSLGWASRQLHDSSLARVRCAAPHGRVLEPLFHIICLIAVLLLVLLVDKRGQQRRARMFRGMEGDVGEESARWLNEALAAAWSPLAGEENVSAGGMLLAKLAAYVHERNTSIGGSGLGAELAVYSAMSLNGGGDVLTFEVERSAFGDTPPRLDGFRSPSMRTARLLTSELHKGHFNYSEQQPRPRFVFLEADLSWVADDAFEVVVRTSATSTVLSAVVPQLRISLTDVIFGPAAVAVALEAAPRGYPYVGLVALTFVDKPDIDFSVTPVGVLGGTVTTVPLMGEALRARVAGALPLADKQEVLVFDLGEYLYPAKQSLKDAEHAAEEADQVNASGHSLALRLVEPLKKQWRRSMRGRRMRQAWEAMVEEVESRATADAPEEMPA